MKTLITLALSSLLAAGCTSEKQELVPEAAPAVAVAQVHDAICGHALPEVGKCGNYLKVDGEYVVLEHPSLGKMDYCGAGEAGAKVKVAGELADGKFVAVSYERIN